MNKNNYDLVLEVIESYDNENVLNDFESDAKVGTKANASATSIKRSTNSIK